MRSLRYSFIRLVSILVLIFTLFGCIPIIKASFEMKLGVQEKWDFVSTLVTSPPVANTLISELNQRFSQDSQPANVKVNIQQLSPDQQGNVPVQISMSGQGYESLNRILGENVITVDESSGERILSFRWSMGSSPTIQSTEFTLHGGKILDHNGTLVDANTVKWVDFSGIMTTTMQEPSLMDYLPWIIFGCGAMVVILGVIALVIVINLTRKKSTHQPVYVQPRQVYHPHQQSLASNRPFSSPQPYQPPSPARPVQPTPESVQSQIKFCLQCRAQIPAHATFCPQCGAKQN